MRLAPSRYALPKPVRVKGKPPAQVAHMSPPLKGLSLSSALTVGDPLTAPILDNFNVEEDRITARNGFKELGFIEGAQVGQPIEAIVPWYGFPAAFLLATRLALHNSAGNPVKTGFTSGDWQWTSFSNLSDVDYTVMVNGANGVWSWDGENIIDPPAVVVTSLSNSNPARCTVASGDIAKFKDGQTVVIAGATGLHAPANGTRIISSVGAPTNTFTLPGIDTAAATGAQVTGVTANPPGSLVKEAVTAPAGALNVVVNNMNVVMSHQNRLWFADQSNLALYYLPLQQKNGALTEVPLNAVFKRGGSIRALYTWTIDGGAGMEDQLVVFSTNGECAIFNGVDPEVDMGLVGVYRFDSPMSKHCIVQYGGDLWVLISTGFVPMSTMMRAEVEQLGKTEKNVVTAFQQFATINRGSPGWSVLLDHSTGRVICNLPMGSNNHFRQMVRLMPRPAWSSWSNLPSRSWAWLDNRLFFGSDDGRLYEMSDLYLNDNNDPIVVDVQAAWSAFRSPGAVKHFKMVYAYIVADAPIRPYIEIRVDYDTSRPQNQPEVSIGDLGAEWDIAEWDVAYWSQPMIPRNNWQGVAEIGRIGAPRLTALIYNCHFSLTGFDVLYEQGSVFG